MRRSIAKNRLAMMTLLSAAAIFPSGGARAARWGADYFPNVPLVTQDGKTVRLYDDLLKDKIVAIDLIYTHCRFGCPVETARLAQVQRMLGGRVGKEIFFYSITLDPKRDTPEVLKAYAEKFHVGPGWLFLTGKPEDIKLVSRKLGLYAEQEIPVNRDGHTPDLMIGDVASGQWMKNSAVDNPRFLAMMIEKFLDSGKSRKPAQSYAQAPPLTIGSKGQYLFATRCTACHTIGQGDRIGPDLLGVTKVRERGWLSRYLAAPDRMLAEGDPIAKALYEKYKRVSMPNLRLGQEDVADLIAYLEAQAAKARDDGSGPRTAGAVVPRP